MCLFHYGGAITVTTVHSRGQVVASLNDATSRKVAGSIPDGVIRIFQWHNPSGHTKALE